MSFCFHRRWEKRRRFLSINLFYSPHHSFDFFKKIFMNMWKISTLFITLFILKSKISGKYIDWSDICWRSSVGYWSIWLGFWLNFYWEKISVKSEWFRSSFFFWRSNERISVVCVSHWWISSSLVQKNKSFFQRRYFLD